MRTIHKLPFPGELYWYNQTILVEYIGKDNSGKFIFKSTNGGIIKLHPYQLRLTIWED